MTRSSPAVVADSLHPPFDGRGASEALQLSQPIHSTTGSRANRALAAAAKLWFVITGIGQLIFVAYIAGFYGSATLRGDFTAWGEVMPHGHVAGDSVGNAVVGVHLLFAALITVSGLVQLLPALRRFAPAAHRRNGRFYVLASLLMSVGGLVMVWTRGTVGGPVQQVAISLNALLILACAGLTLRNAMARRLDAHRRWALRLFLTVSGVWFFRIGLMAWIVINQGPAGFDPASFRGPLLSTLAFAQYLLPLAVLELYFRAQRSMQPRAHYAMAAALTICSALSAVGIAAATMLMWLPRL